MEEFKSDEKEYLEKRVKDLSEELGELQAQNQELRFQQERNNTRLKIKSINDEKHIKEETQRLQKELRVAEVAMKFKASSFESQLKASQDKNDRLQEKLKISNSRFDELDKERLELKLEITRLQNKLEKTGSFVEMKRMQTLQETMQLELENMRKKNAKLEGGLGIGEGEGSLSSLDHKREITKLRNENKVLEEKNESLEQTSEVFSLKVKKLDSLLKTEQNRTKELESELEQVRKISDCGSEEYIASLQKQIESLEQVSSEFETKFKVKEKDLWLTIEAQKKKIEELELAKLSLELGEDEEAESEDKIDTNSELHDSSQLELSNEIKALALENAKLKGALEIALEEHEENRVSSEEIVKELEVASMKLKSTLNESTSEKQKLASDLASCQSELQNLKTQEEKLVKELKMAKAKQDSSQEEFRMLKQQLAELKNMPKDRKGPAPVEVADLKKEVDRLNKLNSQLLEDLEAAEEDANRMEDSVVENIKLHEEIENLNKENRKYREDFESAEEELEKLDAEFLEQTQALKEEIKILKMKNEKQAVPDDAGQRQQTNTVKVAPNSSVMATPIKKTTVVIAKKINTQSSTPSKLPAESKDSSPVPEKATTVSNPPTPAVKPKKQPPPSALKKPSSRRKV